MNMTAPLQPTAIHAVPAELCECGFRLLMIRQFNVGAVPPAFAIIDQRVMRMPQRLGRHGVSFAATFLPEVMSWLIDHLGRPSLHDESGRSYRNPRWPVVCWHDQERYWPSGAVTAVNVFVATGVLYVRTESGRPFRKIANNPDG